MTNPKKLTRRDAIKILGAAAGATALANLPSKWSTPELTSGVLPAHAQASSLGLKILDCGFTSFDINNTGDWGFSATVGPLPLPYDIPVCLTLSFVDTHLSINPAQPQPQRTVCSVANQSDGMTGAALTSGLPLWGTVLPDSGKTSGSVTALLKFFSSADGIDTCSKTMNWSNT